MPLTVNLKKQEILEFEDDETQSLLSYKQGVLSVRFGPKRKPAPGVLYETENKSMKRPVSEWRKIYWLLGEILRILPDEPSGWNTAEAEQRLAEEPPSA